MVLCNDVATDAHPVDRRTVTCLYIVEPRWKCARKCKSAAVGNFGRAIQVIFFKICCYREIFSTDFWWANALQWLRWEWNIIYWYAVCRDTQTHILFFCGASRYTSIKCNRDQKHWECEKKNTSSVTSQFKPTQKQTESCNMYTGNGYQDNSIAILAQHNWPHTHRQLIGLISFQITLKLKVYGIGNLMYKNSCKKKQNADGTQEKVCVCMCLYNELKNVTLHDTDKFPRRVWKSKYLLFVINQRINRSDLLFIGLTWCYCRWSIIKL